MDSCIECNKKFTDRDKFLSCSVCTRRSHYYCQNITATDFAVLQKQMAHLHWYCKNCKLGAEALHKQMVLLQGKMTHVEHRLDALESKAKESDEKISSKIDETLESKLGETLDSKVDEVLKTKFDAAKDSMRDELKLEVTNSIKSEISEISDKAGPSEDRVQEIATKSTEEALKEPIILNSVVKEIEDRERRKNNIILHGLSESKEENNGKRKEDDINRCNSILKIADKELDIDSCGKYLRLGRFQDGKTRPMVIEVRNGTTKEKIMAGSKNLKDTDFKEIRISHDLTKQLRKELNEHLKEARDKTTTEQKFRVVGNPGFWRVQVVKDKQ